MANVIEKQVYTAIEVATMFGMTKQEKASMTKDLDEGKFPIPAFRIRNRWYFNKKTINRLFDGKGDYSGDTPTLDEIKSNRFRKEDPAKMASITFKVKRQLNDQFNRVCTNINMEIDKPLNKGDYLRIALEEFIERRPQYTGERYR